MHHRYCPVCGSRTEKESCCWFLGDEEEDDPRPYTLVPAKPWGEWSEEHRFLIALMMEQFGGAAEEWELLCRLPWPEWRFTRSVCEPWGERLVSATDHPCIRETHGFRTRYYLCDLARDAYTALRLQESEGYPPRLLWAW